MGIIAQYHKDFLMLKPSKFSKFAIENTLFCQAMIEKSTPGGREALLRRRNGLPRTATGRGLSCCRAAAAAARTAVAWPRRTTRWRRSCWRSWARARWGAASASGRRSHKTSSAHSRNRSVVEPGFKELDLSCEIRHFAWAESVGKIKIYQTYQTDLEFLVS